MTPLPHLFASALLDQSWILTPHDRHNSAQSCPHTERFECGFAVAPGESDPVTLASDNFGSFPTGILKTSGLLIEQRLHAEASRVGPPQNLPELDGVAGVALRRFSSSRMVAVADLEQWDRSVHYIATVDYQSRRLSVVSDADTLSEDFQLLLNLARVGGEVDADQHERVPFLWRNGSAAVLFHELIGHACETQTVEQTTPEWLRVLDDPTRDGLGSMSFDDRGVRPAIAILTRGERPQAFRRPTFRDVPSLRMTNLVIDSDRPECEIPQSRIEILLIDGGTYDPLTDSIRIEVSVADVIHAGNRQRLRPFSIRSSRTDAGKAIVGTRGALERYPGVICSNDGKRLPVGSFAPELLTETFGL